MIEARPDKVGHVFSNYSLKVPIYQRKFEWRQSEAVELIEDLNSNNNRKGIFLGTIILKIISEENDIYEIVDGQQRITTLSILYLALRMGLDQGHKLGTSIDRMLYNMSDNFENQPVLKPSPSISRLYNYIMAEEWDGKFPDSIDNRGIKREVKKIKPIYDEFSKYIDPFAHDIEWTKKLFHRITNSYFVTLKASEDEDIYEIFERSNARGLQLGLGDLLRNFIASNQKEAIFEAWEDISDKADNLLPKILKYFIVCRYGYTPKSEVYKKIKDYVKDNSTERLEVFLKELEEFTVFFVESQKDHVQIDNWLEEFYPKSDELKSYDRQEINRILGALRFFKVSQPLPLIYNLTKKILGGGITKKRYIRLLKTIENFHCINTLVLNGAANQMEMFYAKMAYMVNNGEIVYESIINNCRHELYNKEVFIDAFREEIVYSGSKYDREAVIYFIDKIENHRSGSDRKGDEYKILFVRDGRKKSSNIEHILPQSSSDQTGINYFGNLLYIPIQSNSRLGNISPSEKRKIFLEDSSQYGDRYHVKLWCDSYQGEDDSWDKEAIVKRTDELAELLYDEVLKIP